MLQIAYPIMISEMKTKMFLNEKRIRNISLFTDHISVTVMHKRK